MERRTYKNNAKRLAALGFCYVFSLAILTACLVSTADAGCAGDCYTCHENLRGDATHKSLGTCASCHDGTNPRLSLMPRVNVNGGCGSHCFDCHNYWPRNSFHADLDTCLKCHEGGGDNASKRRL